MSSIDPNLPVDTRSLHIVHIESGRHWRGAQVQVLHTLLGQRELGHHVELIAPEGSELAKKARDEGIEVHHLGMRITHYRVDVGRMTRLFKQAKPDIVHLHSSHAHNVGGLAARLAKVPAVVLSRRMDTPIKLIHHKLKYQFGYDRIIAISEGVKAALVKAGVKSHRISVVRSAIEDTWWTVIGSRESVRKDFGYSEDDLVVTIIAAVEPRKGQELLIRALPKILEKAPNVKVCFAGKDELSQPERLLAKELKVEDKVLFAGFRPDVHDVIAASDIVAAPSYLEGLGVSIMESMACGKPVVASNVGGIPESVIDGLTGFLVPTGDEAALAEAITKLARDENLRDEMGRKGKERAMAEFSIPVLIQSTLEVYCDLLSTPRCEHRKKAKPVTTA